MTVATGWSTEPQRLFGRVDEMASIVNFLGALEQPRFLLIEGEPGIGKTRLAAEWLHAARREVTGAWLRSPEGSVAPFDSVHRFVTAVFSGRDDLYARDLVAPLFEPVSSTSDGAIAAVRREQLAEIASAILDSVDVQPLVAVVDDLHWIHPLSLALVETLMDQSIDRQVSGFGVISTGRPVPESHPAVSLLARFSRSPHAETMQLGALGRAACDDLVRDHRPGVGPGFTALVGRSARGNPLRVRAVLEVLSDVGSEDEAYWTRREVLQPVDLSDPVVTWIERIHGNERRLLQTCAILSGDFDLDRTAAATGLGLDEVADILLDLARTGVLASDGQNYWFAHPQYREVIERSINSLQRRQIHVSCAKSLLESDTDRIGDASAIGRHLLACETAIEGVDTVGLFAAAGDEALGHTSWDEAIRFYLAAISAEPPDDVRAALHQKVGRALSFNADVEAAERHFRIAVDYSAANEDHEAWCSSIVSLLWAVNSMRAEALHMPAGVDVVRSFLDVVEDPLLRSRVIQVQAEGYLFANDLEAGSLAADEALALAEQTEDAHALALGHYAVGYAAMSRSRVSDALRHTSEALKYAAVAGDWYVEAGIQARRSFAVLSAADLTEAQGLAATSFRTAVRHDEFSAQALSGAILANVAALRGDLMEARRHCERASSAARRSNYNLAGFFLAPIRAGVDILLGEPDHIAAELETWQLPSAVTGPLLELAGAHEGGLRVPSRTQVTFREPTMIEGGVIACRTELGLATRQHELLESLLPILANYDRIGLVVPPSQPCFVPRLIGEVHLELGRYGEAKAAFDRSIGLAERSGAQVELARSVIGLAATTARTEGASRDVVHQLATRGVTLAEQLGLQDFAARARGIRGSHVDAPAAVNARGGAWYVVLATDLRGSTEMSNVEGDKRYHRMVVEHHALVKAQVALHGGTVWSDEGDGLYSFFHSSEGAAAAALAIRSGFEAARRSPNSPQVKIALGGGEPLFDDGRPYGLVVNRTAHVLNNAEPGEILADEAMAASLSPDQLMDTGRMVELKSIGPHQVFSLAPTASNNRTTITEA